MQRYFNEISVNIGVPVIRISTSTGQVGAFDAGTVFALSFQPRVWQRKTVRGYAYTIWSFALGVSVGYNQSINRFDFGIMLVPYQFRYEFIAIGVGVALMTNATGKFELTTNNLHLVIPLTICF